MEAYYDLLRTTALFRGISPEGIEQLMRCFAPGLRSFEKSELLLLAGFETSEIGILLEGRASAVKTTPDGTAVSIIDLSPGSVFGDVMAGGAVKSPVTITAHTHCRVLFIPCKKLLCPCAAMHPEHTQLMQNLVSAISEKYFALSHRVDLLILKSLRSKLCAYLLGQAQAAGADTFLVPFSRAGLAEYLNCERSALSRELSRMRAEGLIETYKNSFKLLNKEALRSQYENQKGDTL